MGEFETNLTQKVMNEIKVANVESNREIEHKVPIMWSFFLYITANFV
jgi:hypothetical protein